MTTIYRLEDKDGNGPFFYRNGVARFNSDIKSNDVGLFGFTDKSRFKEQSYIKFYRDEEFSLYEIVVSDVLERRNGQAVFLENAIVTKRKVIKDTFYRG